MIDVIAKAKERIKAAEDEFSRLSGQLVQMERQLSGGRDRQIMLQGEISALRRLVQESDETPKAPPSAENIPKAGTGEGEKN
jgi:predicted  nucleic acid-binding Zn-ribbon protein